MTKIKIGLSYILNLHYMNNKSIIRVADSSYLDKFNSTENFNSENIISQTKNQNF